jgi:23S rRNA (cytosine1962-C5)-methyltransferase
VLRNYQREGRRFDVIVLDPPKFAENKSQVMKAARAYKDLALQAARLVTPGGLLVNFSCSGAIDLNLFQKITADALLDAGRSAGIIRYLHQPADHPVALHFPESQYLKGLVSLID